MLDAGVRAMRVGQGRACISARESITCSLTVSLMDWWRRVGVPCFSFNEQCDGARGGGSRDARGGRHLHREVPPASFLPKNHRGLALACGGVDATVHHAAFTLQATIDFSPMTNSEDLNNNRTVINGVQDAVISYSRPVPFFAL